MEEKDGADVKIYAEITELVTSEGFKNMPENIQEKALNSIEATSQNEGGWMGRIFGTKKENAAMNIAFTLCGILLIFCGIDIIHAVLIGKVAYTELVKGVIPVVTLTLGYIFGKSEK